MMYEYLYISRFENKYRLPTIEEKKILGYYLSLTVPTSEKKVRIIVTCESCDITQTVQLSVMSLQDVYLL